MKSEDEPSRDVTPKENETTIVDDDKPLTPLLDDVGVINNQEKKGVTFAETNLVLERMINDRSEDADIESEGGNLPQDKQDTAVVVVGDDDISFASDFGEADIESVPVCSNLSELTYSTDTTKVSHLHLLISFAVEKHNAYSRSFSLISFRKIPLSKEFRSVLVLCGDT